MKVYKVVTDRYGMLTSACTTDVFPEEYRTEYDIGVEVKPRVEGTMLFAFLDLKEAQNFANSSSKRKVYEAETPYVVKDIIPQEVESFYQTKLQCKSNIKSFWEDYTKSRKAKKKTDKRGKNPRREFAYKTSVCCPSLTLIKEIPKQ